MTEEPKSKKRGIFLIVLFVGVVFVAAFLSAILSDHGDVRSHTVVLMMNLNTASAAYITDNGVWPKKINNADLFAVLSGADSGKVYMTFPSRNISQNGEVQDDWGTPLRVTRVSDTQLKIESDGPDKMFGTEDDITNQ